MDFSNECTYICNSGVGLFNVGYSFFLFYVSGVLTHYFYDSYFNNQKLNCEEEQSEEEEEQSEEEEEQSEEEQSEEEEEQSEEEQSDN